MKPLNVLSLCDGISGGQAALRAAGIKVNKYFASEIDKHAIAITQYNFPNTIQIGSIIDVKGRNGKLLVGEEEHEIDLILSGTPCFVKGTKVSTSKGLAPIENIALGDMVETHTGEYKPVVKKWYKAKAPIREVKAQGFIPTYTTDEHPYLVRKRFIVWDNENRTVVRKFAEPEWVKAKDLKRGDFIGKRIPETKVASFLSNDELRILGRYLADGHTRKGLKPTGNRYWVLYLSISDKKTPSFLASLENPDKCRVYPHTKGVNRIIIYSKKLVELAEENMGSGAGNKYLSNKLLGMPKEDCKVLLEAYLEGDGYRFKEGGYKVATVSERLAINLTYLIAKVYGACPSIGVRKYKDGKGVIEGRVVNMRDSYQLQFTTEPSIFSKHYTEDGIMWSEVRSSELTGNSEEVYNLEVADNNTYVANGAIVHNCTGFSFAGRQLNFNDPQSKLFFDFVRIRGEINHKYYLLENVKMKKEYLDTITANVGNDPILINSSLLSAQSRQRYYWTNIPNVTQPEDRNIDPMSILEFQGTVINYSSSGRGGGKIEGRFTKAGKTLTLTATGYTNRGATLIVGKTYGFPPLRIFKKTLKFPCLTATMYKGVQSSGRPIITWDDCLNSDIREIDKGNYRLPTPLECERLQTFLDFYTQYGNYDGEIKEVSNTQRYKCLGNSWTVEVIAHILSGMNYKEEYEQL